MRRFVWSFFECSKRDASAARAAVKLGSTAVGIRTSEGVVRERCDLKMFATKFKKKKEKLTRRCGVVAAAAADVLGWSARAVAP